MNDAFGRVSEDSLRPCNPPAAAGEVAYIEESKCKPEGAVRGSLRSPRLRNA